MARTESGSKRTEGRVRFVKGHSPREQSERILKMLGDGIRSGVGGSVRWVVRIGRQVVEVGVGDREVGIGVEGRGAEWEVVTSLR